MRLKNEATIAEQQKMPFTHAKHKYCTLWRENKPITHVVTKWTTAELPSVIKRTVSFMMIRFFVSKVMPFQSNNPPFPSFLSAKTHHSSSHIATKTTRQPP
jgi:hypothetical protein